MLVDGKLKTQNQPNEFLNERQHGKDLSAEEIAALSTDASEIELQETIPQQPPVSLPDVQDPLEQQLIDEIENENENPFPEDILDASDVDDLFDFWYS